MFVCPPPTVPCFMNLQYSEYKCGQDPPSLKLRDTSSLVLARELGRIWCTFCISYVSRNPCLYPFSLVRKSSRSRNLSRNRSRLCIKRDWTQIHSIVNVPFRGRRVQPRRQASDLVVLAQPNTLTPFICYWPKVLVVRRNKLVRFWVFIRVHLNIFCLKISCSGKSISNGFFIYSTIMNSWKRFKSPQAPGIPRFKVRISACEYIGCFTTH
jgi:hypothetical protein